MAYCRKCGAQIDDEAVICPKCGVPVNKFTQVREIRENVLPDSGGFGWGLLGFLLPWLGFILYLIWKDTKPKTASSLGKGALWSVLTVVILFILITCLVAIA